MDWRHLGCLWIIVMFLFSVWTLILTASIHCRGSIGERVMYSLHFSKSIQIKIKNSSTSSQVIFFGGTIPNTGQLGSPGNQQPCSKATSLNWTREKKKRYIRERERKRERERETEINLLSHVCLHPCMSKLAAHSSNRLVLQQEKDIDLDQHSTITLSTQAKNLSIGWRDRKR